VDEAMDMREHRLWDDDDFYLLDDPMEQESAHPAHSAWIYSQVWNGCNATFFVSAACPKTNAHL
jgi:hypothetical protein